jgi:predicted DNA-binding transcriptional regulator AlpA
MIGTETTESARRLLTTAEVAGILTISVATLKKFRRLGQGPLFLRLGPRAVRYVAGDVARWLEQRRDGRAVK